LSIQPGRLTTSSSSTAGPIRSDSTGLAGLQSPENLFSVRRRIGCDRLSGTSPGVENLSWAAGRSPCATPQRPLWQ
jgi:hypothetical protein